MASRWMGTHSRVDGPTSVVTNAKVSESLKAVAEKRVPRRLADTALMDLSSGDLVEAETSGPLHRKMP